ncbi:MAG: hypothetical protein KF830_05690 [Planctomycetes bacterium]|nr:hypothetical protein [Planctomycetota bacterium]
MNAWTLLLPIPLVAAVTFVPGAAPPQGPEKPAGDDVTAVVQLSELHYTTPDGVSKVVPGRSVVEIRVLTDAESHIRLELLYDNGDYSLIDALAMHLLRNRGGSHEVRLVRGRSEKMRFPRLP